MPILIASKRGKGGQGKEPLAVQISEQDADLTSQKWSYSTMANGTPYVHSHHQYRHAYLARTILERMLQRPLARQEEVNYIDGNTLNCQRENLRLAHHAQVIAHRGQQRNNTSGYKGVFWLKSEGKWKAEITIDGKTLSLGRFTDKHEAARAYNAAALHYLGAFAFQNVISEAKA